MNPLISVIITTRNEEKNIRNCLESIKKQSYPSDKIEIIIVDNFSEDKTVEIARDYTDKIFVKGPERSVQKNYGVNQSKGDFFVHLDADMVLSNQVLEECVEKVKGDSNLVALYIPEIVMGDKFFSRVRRFERSFYDATPIDGVRFIKRDVFLAVGGFDERMYACEDWDITKKLKKNGKIDIIQAVLYHNEAEFNLKKYLLKKGYYSGNMDVYIEKWGKDDSDLKKQFGLYYRFIGVFLENGKWTKLIAHPILTLGMYYLRILVGASFIINRK